MRGLGEYEIGPLGQVTWSVYLGLLMSEGAEGFP